MTTPGTVPELFDAAVRRWPDRTALRYSPADRDPISWTFAQWADYASRAAAHLRRNGVNPGDRVLLMMRNIPEFWVADMAVLLCGAVPVSVYNSSSPEQVAYLADNSGAVAAVTTAEFASRFPTVDPTGSSFGHLTVLDDDTWTQFVSGPAIEDRPDPDPDALATMIYTSGTTGPPKGVMLTHRNICWTLGSTAPLMAYAEPEGQRLVSYLPMAHIAERMVSYYQQLQNGYDVTCVDDPSGLVGALVTTKPGILFGVPRVWEKARAGLEALIGADPDGKTRFDRAVTEAIPLADRVAAGEGDDTDRTRLAELDAEQFAPVRQMLGLDELRLAVTGAAPLPVDALRWLRAIGIPISEIYGLSETSGPMTWSPQQPRSGTVGQAIPGCDVRLGEDGEIMCRGGNVFAGYWQQPDKTAEVLDDDGWFHSGDIGTVDGDGYYKIVDRKKELIITAGGKNISPANLEAAIKAVPLVGNAFVYGDQRPFVVAVVTLDPDLAPMWATQQGIEDSDLETLAHHPQVVTAIEDGVAAQMQQFNNAEAVKKVAVVGDDWQPDSDVLTPTSKLKRRGLIAKYQDVIESLYAPTS